MHAGTRHAKRRHAKWRMLSLSALLVLQACGNTTSRVDADGVPLEAGSASAVRADTDHASADGGTAPRDVSRLGAFMAKPITESSAAVRSFGHDGVYWTLNDSGNDERLFAFDTTGRDLGAVRVTGARNRDWEAMATGPCEAGRCLYIGDVGDNLARHKAVVVWRIAEPTPPGAARRSDSEPAIAIAVQYPEGPRDVEAMWVDADTVLWLATKRPLRDAGKRWRPSLLYRVPASAWRSASTAMPPPVRAELVDSLPIVPRAERSFVTDAAMSNPFGDPARDSLLAVRTYGEVLVFRVRRSSGRPLALLGRCELASLREKQGEGVSWLPDGRLLLTSEKRAAALHGVRCP